MTYTSRSPRVALCLFLEKKIISYRGVPAELWDEHRRTRTRTRNCNAVPSLRCFLLFFNRELVKQREKPIFPLPPFTFSPPKHKKSQNVSIVCLKIDGFPCKHDVALPFVCCTHTLYVLVSAEIFFFTSSLSGKCQEKINI